MADTGQEPGSPGEPERAPIPFTIDIELTNRCNATCRFCPRDRTPSQGLMAPATFDRVLERIVEHVAAVHGERPPKRRTNVTFCGMGEPLLHPRLPEYVGRVAAAGLRPNLSSNGSLLDERRAGALLEAGLRTIWLNVGELGADYERTYGLPFERTVRNVVRFRELSAGRCEVIAVLVDHRDDPGHLDAMRDHWSTLGIDHTFTYDLANRGGSLVVDHMRFDEWPEPAEAWQLLNRRAGTPICNVPFHRFFVGHEGRYHLCSQDWEKRPRLGDVFGSSFLDVTAAKLACVVQREPVCRTCSCDPTNEVAAAMRAGGDLEAAVEAQALRISLAHGLVAAAGHEVPSPSTPPRRPSVPVHSAS